MQLFVFTRRQDRLLRVMDVFFRSVVLYFKSSQIKLYLFRARGGGGAVGASAPHYFGNFKELLRKRCFQQPHFESLFNPPTFKVAPRALLFDRILATSCFSAKTDTCFKITKFIFHNHIQTNDKVQPLPIAKN